MSASVTVSDAADTLAAASPSAGTAKTVSVASDDAAAASVKRIVAAAAAVAVDVDALDNTSDALTDTDIASDDVATLAAVTTTRARAVAASAAADAPDAVNVNGCTIVTATAAVLDAAALNVT